MGFGFGAIQSGLFLFEAFLSGNFERFVVAEVDQAVIDAVRANGNRYAVNIARKDRIDQLTVEGVELYNPNVPADREELIEAVARSDEMATALPSVNFYDIGGPAAVVEIIRQGISRRTELQPTIIYAAENHNHAAGLLHEKLAEHLPAQTLRQLQTLNTVIGKMSGVIADEQTIGGMGLTTITPDIPRAMLVEEFNRILISRIELPGYRRGIDVLLEKTDLLPFEEAKLFGHNAIHALIAYLAESRGLNTIADAAGDTEIMDTARKAFIDECGAALIRKHDGLGDPLFTPVGFRDYADDLLERMVCPYLNDLVWRVGRDHLRKLGYDDRLFGTMRVVLGQGLTPTNLAIGAAAGVLSMIRRQDEIDAKNRPANMLPQANDLSPEKLRALLLEIWGPDTDSHAEILIPMTWKALQTLGDA